MKQMKSIIESILFATGECVEISRLAEILDVDIQTVKQAIDEMKVSYDNSSRGMIIKEISEGYQLATKPENYEYVKKLFEPRQRQELSRAAFEVLAIIAYNQPVTRVKIESIRGVGSERAISSLAERNLICEIGRMDAPGRPILYGVTEEFLRSFGFKSIDDLPMLGIDEMIEKSRVNEESEIEIPITLISDRVKNKNEVFENK